MSSTVATVRRRFRTLLSPEQQRGVRVLAWASVVSLAGVTVTGLWQFFTHESDPGWYGYVTGAEIGLTSSPSVGAAELRATCVSPI